MIISARHRCSFLSQADQSTSGRVWLNTHTHTCTHANWQKKKKKAEVMEQHSVVEPHTQYLTLAALAQCDLPPSPATDKQGERSLLITLLSAAPCHQRRRCHSHSSGGGLLWNLERTFQSLLLPLPPNALYSLFTYAAGPAHSVCIFITRSTLTHSNFMLCPTLLDHCRTKKLAVKL